ncbi:hypothetical protein B0A55_10228 [Friedmanniomyces simplex]|uniref:RTA1 domain protein n=1 Tax=Friedmanniomyces simplex TaxID=329884 RepID=A0A4U0WT98_9PEZI|nr:hypothetical protein B0A55_10228 [Friedmanniomyces simplex]
MAQCKTITDPNTTWPPFCPNIAASYLYAILFGITAIAHLVQTFWTRKCIMQPANDMMYTLWFVLMLIAPIFTNAYVYMVMGRMVYNFTAKGSVGGIKAWRFGLIFVLLDVLAFLVQAGGAVIASGTGKSMNTIMMGLHIYMGGIGFQQLCILAFLALAARFHLNLRAQPVSAERSKAFRLLYVEYAVLLLITIRIIFRLAEYSNGLDSSIPEHEAYQYVLDSTPMLTALVLFNAVHPGFTMRGAESNLPARKERKAMKKAGERPTGRAGEYVMMGSKQDFTMQGRESEVETGLMPPSPPTGAYRYDVNNYSRSASPAEFRG